MKVGYLAKANIQFFLDSDAGFPASVALNFPRFGDGRKKQAFLAVRERTHVRRNA